MSILHGVDPYGPKVTCPTCSQELGPYEVGDWEVSKRARSIYALAVVTSIAWIATLLLWSAPFLVLTGIGSLLLCGMFYLGPGLLIGLYANIQPKTRALRCESCHWTGTQEGP